MIGPAFSTWWDWTPFDSLVAMARSARFAAELSHYLPTIPSLVWRNERDIDRWAAWLMETGPEAIAVDLGTARSRFQWAVILHGIEHLSQSIGRQMRLRLVVDGPSTINRMRDIRDAWTSDLTFASQNPWHLAQGGKRLLEDLSAMKEGRSRAELEELNRRTFDRVATRIVESDR